MLSNIFWKPLAWLISMPKITNWLIKRSQLTPYIHIDNYMNRWWLFNPYNNTDYGSKAYKKFAWLPSIRIHHILREDYARDNHNHPWIARTIILKGDYDETRLKNYYRDYINSGGAFVYEYEKSNRVAGDTATLTPDDFHNITRVSDGGVWTLFITWKYQQNWGFLVDGKVIPHELYEEKS